MKSNKDEAFQDLDTVLSTSAGRRFAWRLISPVESDPTMGDTNATFYALGLQSTARALQQEIINRHFVWYQVMIAERYSDSEEKTCVAKDSE